MENENVMHGKYWKETIKLSNLISSIVSSLNLEIYINYLAYFYTINLFILYKLLCIYMIWYILIDHAQENITKILMN